MSMSKALLPTEGSEPSGGPMPREPHGMSLDEAIHEFIRLEARRVELKQEIGDVLAVLLPEAFEIRGQQNTVRLTGQDGKQIKVEFKESHKCNSNELNLSREMLGDDKFEELFKTEYSPRLRELRMFLSSKSTDERIETAKVIIKRGCIAVQRSPFVSIEKG